MLLAERLILFAAVAMTLAVEAQPIPRNQPEIAAFKRANPCPATGRRLGPCPGHQVDHADPICAGGRDRRENMQWLTTQEHRWKTRSDLRMCRLHRRTNGQGHATLPNDAER